MRRGEKRLVQVVSRLLDVVKAVEEEPAESRQTLIDETVQPFLNLMREEYPDVFETVDAYRLGS